MTYDKQKKKKTQPKQNAKLFFPGVSDHQEEGQKVVFVAFCGVPNYIS